ncbi:hypothetical protein [Thermomonospora amylolytica]|uniref:hypothetical protein n=1 Tax=Thermomonospora amylolytica TaxID=1411117 RepID=UPI0018E56F75|nr:hypothetical protein [Thermomonospora amylolytica]
MAQQNVHELRWGYNLADLDVLTLASLRRGARSGVVPARECYQAAWSAIAEHLATAEERPDPYALIGAGMRAISETIQAGERAHGWNNQRQSIRPGFATFWMDATGPTPSPEGPIVDRTALWQIWPRLTDLQRQTLLALATYEDYRTAAAAVGASYGTFCERVRLARIAFLTLWHEGEMPSRVWSADRRRWRDGRPVRSRHLQSRRRQTERAA